MLHKHQLYISSIVILLAHLVCLCLVEHAAWIGIEAGVEKCRGIVTEITDLGNR
jgi:hypothetical protein